MGDYVRWAPPFHEGVSTRRSPGCNRAEPQQALDPPQPRRRRRASEALRALARDYDVLVERFRPGVLDRLGVGYDELQRENPALVYCPITGYGQDGPNRDRAGHDMNYLGLNGVLGLTGERGRPADPARGPDRRPRRRRR